MSRLRLISVVLLAALAASCSSSNNGSTPTGPSTTTSTRVINVTGSLAFGDVQVGSQASQSVTVSNTGNSTLTISDVTYSGTGGSSIPFFITTSAFTVTAGSSQTLTVSFRPSAAANFVGTLTFKADQTSGSGGIAISGNAVAAPPPALYSLTGTITDGTSHGVLPNIGVEITSGANDGLSTVTNGSGVFTFTGLSAGSLTITAGATSYLTASSTITLSSNTTLNITLQRTSTAPPTTGTRVGARCSDGTTSMATGSGACSHHGGVMCWIYSTGACTLP